MKKNQKKKKWLNKKIKFQYFQFQKKAINFLIFN